MHYILTMTMSLLFSAWHTEFVMPQLLPVTKDHPMPMNQEYIRHIWHALHSKSIHTALKHIQWMQLVWANIDKSRPTHIYVLLCRSSLSNGIIKRAVKMRPEWTLYVWIRTKTVAQLDARYPGLTELEHADKDISAEHTQARCSSTAWQWRGHVLVVRFYSESSQS